MTSEHCKGYFIVVIGPDGVGKTSLADAIIKTWPTESAYFHFRPPLMRRLDGGPADAGHFVQTKPQAEQAKRVAGWLRLGLNFARFWLGYLLRVRPATKRGKLVVGDRWAYGYIAQPAPLKFYGPDWLARAAIRLMPPPDLVVRLTAPPDVVRSRKAELTEIQIEEEDSLWASLPVRQMITIDARMALEANARQVLAALDAKRGPEGHPVTDGSE